MNGGTGKTSYAINSRLAVSLFKGFFFFLILWSSFDPVLLS